MSASTGSPDLLRFMTCGSVDDGKSTLIGRLLYETGSVYDDQLEALTHTARNGELDFSLLVDGLAAEREQGITIDVAYRYFSTPRRKFIVADTPGHEQYTRNMATAASNAELALLLVDARKGLLPQTRRHSFLAALFGVKRVVLAVNKMDLVDFSQVRFEAIAADYAKMAGELGIEDIHVIPVSAAQGDNLTAPSARMSWYTGATLLEHLETAVAATDLADRPFRMPVQQVNRATDFRGFAGLIASGEIRPGDRVRVLPSGKETRVSRIVSAGGDLPRAAAGDAPVLALEDELDISRGDVIAAATTPPETADDFHATLVWMDEAPLHSRRRYLMKIGAKTVHATVAELVDVLDIESFGRGPAEALHLNDIGDVRLGLDERIAFEPYTDNRTLGGFILIDPATHATVGAGLIRSAFRRSHVYWQALDVDRRAHAALKGQRPAVIWFTGLSGAGKSTIANLLEKRLHAAGRHTYLLDGDNLRHGLNRDLGFSRAERAENVRRVSEVAKLMADAGLIVLVSLISPYREERRTACEVVGPEDFIEVFVDTPLGVAESRDPKGLYRRARSGELHDFTGVGSPYEAPENPDLRLDGARASPEQNVERIMAYLERRADPGAAAPSQPNGGR